MKKLLGLIVASLASFFFLYALVSRDQPARHTGLLAADLPPLIAIHALYSASVDERAGNGARAAFFGSGTKIGWRPQVGNQNSMTTSLSLPQTGSDPGPLPAVVVIRSAQASGISQDHERTVRFLTNRGYAVVSIDCRLLTSKTSGPGMADDAYSEPSCTAAAIREEVKSLVEQDIADPDALAVIGSGIGGYLALMTMEAEPGLFKAAILHSAVIDRPRPANQGTPALRPLKAVVTDGQDTGQGGRKVTPIATTSPSDLARSIQGAVLITHGKADTLVPVEHAEAFASKVRASGKNVETVYFNHERHCYSRWQTLVLTARLTETFLARHLGGRNGGYDYIELLAKLF